MKNSLLVVLFAALMTFAFGSETATFGMSVPVANAKDNEDKKSESDKDKEDSKSKESSEKKVTICHYPPGNPENMQTITVGESAVSAHFDHGDSMGACAESEKSKEDNKSSSNKENDDKSKSSDDKESSSKNKENDDKSKSSEDSKSSSSNKESDDESKSSEDGKSSSSKESDDKSKSSEDSKSSSQKESEGDSNDDGKSDENDSEGNKTTICHYPPGNPANMQTLSVADSAVATHTAHGDTMGQCPSCVCPPGVSSCTCADGTPGADPQSATPSANSTSTFREIIGQ